MISREAARKILGIEEDVYLEPEEMADKLNITFYPYDPVEVSADVLAFSARLKETLVELGANIVPFEKALERVPIRKRLRRVGRIMINNVWYGIQKLIGSDPANPYINIPVLFRAFRSKRIKAGISIIALGEQATGNLPMDNTSSFRKSSVISILDKPKHINRQSGFHDHFNTAMKLFAYHMTNIVLAVDKKEWIIYNFNASHPIFDLNDGKFKEHVLHGLVPKIVAPIRPYRFSEFSVQKRSFDVHDEEHETFVHDLVRSGTLLETTGLYPPGKSIKDLPFRNRFYEWIGKIHLDNRNGMSYGFLAVQMPSELSEVFSYEKARERFPKEIEKGKDWFYQEENLYVVASILDTRYVLKVPDVWVLSQRSGCNKTHMDPERDVIKMGLISGQMYLQAPRNVVLDDGYKPSFDTKVILAHAVGHAVIASLSAHLGIHKNFVESFVSRGRALGHWHGYINPSGIPEGWFVHGMHNPHVSCSSPQSAIYALRGKMRVFETATGKGEEFLGDIHIEPHHGTNLSYPTLTDLGTFLARGPEVSVLGNEYLLRYSLT
ncbi:MAG: hypothetical protein H8D63_01915 [Parcubacteria group bacterium]|nr:hypothetical protein [Parcubacteria group bacterium]